VALADLATLEVEADVAEANVAKVANGQPAEVTVEAIPDRRYQAVLRQVIPTADRTKATVMVKVTILDKDEDLKPEMSAKVTFLEPETETSEQPAETAPVVLVWSVVYATLGLRLAAAIPLLYAVITVAGLILLARTRRIGLFRASQMTLWLFLPFLLQWSLGGFANGSAVGMWAIGAPLLASLVGAVPWFWFLGFLGLSVVSGLIDHRLAAAAPSIPQELVVALFVINFVGLVFVFYVSLGFFIRERERMRLALADEREKSERLLLNILPEEIAARLKAGEVVIADRVEGVTILFADLVGSTPLSEQLTPVQLVEVLDSVFTAFDDLADALAIDDAVRLKALGDPLRLHICDLVLERAMSVSELAEPHGMSLPGFLKHLRVLEDAGLIARNKEGRVVSCELSAAPMRAAAAWMQRYEKFWTDKLDALARYLYQQEELQTWNKPASPKSPPSSSRASTPSSRKRSGGRGPARRR